MRSGWMLPTAPRKARPPFSCERISDALSIRRSEYPATRLTCSIKTSGPGRVLVIKGRYFTPGLCEVAVGGETSRCQTLIFAGSALASAEKPIRDISSKSAAPPRTNGDQRLRFLLVSTSSWPGSAVGLTQEPTTPSRFLMSASITRGLSEPETPKPPELPTPPNPPNPPNPPKPPNPPNPPKPPNPPSPEI